MPILRRIHHGNQPASTGGGGGPTSAFVAWGPNFGGTDGDQYTVNAATSMPTVRGIGNHVVGAAGRLVAVAASGFSRTIGVHEDMTVSTSYANGVGVAARTDKVSPTYNHGIGAHEDMALVNATFGNGVGAHLSGSALGAPFFQVTSTAVTTSVTNTATVTAPSGIQDGDLLLFLVATANTAATITGTPSGTTAIRNDATASITANSYWKIAASESGNYTFTASANTTWAIACLLIRGVNQTTPINVSGGQTGNATDPIAPTITTTVANTMLVAWCSQAETLANTYTAPSGYVERADLNSSILGGVTVAGALSANTRVQAAIGASGTATMDSTQILATNYLSQHIAIAPGSVTIAS